MIKFVKNNKYNKYKKIKPKKIEDIILLKNNVSSDIKRILIKKYV